MRVMQMDVFKFIETTQLKYDVIFAGPPYPLPTLNTIPDQIFKYALVDGDGWFILEHNPNHNFDKHPHFYKKKNYGTTIFSVFSNNPKKEEDETSTENV